MTDDRLLKKINEEYEEEPVTAWTYIGLAFMGLSVIFMIICVIWMATW